MSTKIFEKEAVSRDLYMFMKHFWNTFESETFNSNWHLEYLCEVFMWNVRVHLPEYILNDWMSDKEFNERLKLLDGFNIQNIRKTKLYEKKPKYLNINIAPRSSKSSIFNIAGPTWLFTHSPVKILSISHNRELSNAMNSGRQKIISSEKYAEMYPEIQIVTNTTQKLVGAHNGQMSSIGFKITGFGGDIVINDDIIDATEAAKNKQELANAIRFYEDSLPSRIVHPDTSIIMNIQQRLAKGDITGVITDNPGLRKQYEFIVLKAVAEDDEVFVYPCSGRIKVRKRGELLWERNRNLYLSTQESNYSKYQTQFQQDPTADEDTIIKDADIQYLDWHEAKEILEDHDYSYASHDLTITDSELSDMNASVLGFRRGAKLLIADAIEAKMGFTRQKNHIVDMEHDFPGIIQIIENKANGHAIFDALKDEVPGLVLYDPGIKSKAQRLQLAKDRIRSVYFVKDKDGNVPKRLKHLIELLTKYPYIVHDDLIDGFSQLVNYTYTQARGGFFANSYSSRNLIDTKKTELLLEDVKTDIIGALTRSGNLWKGLKINWDSVNDRFIVLDERVIISAQNEAVTEYREFFKDCRFVMDASENSILSMTISQQLLLLEPFDERPITLRLAQLQAGFSLGKILISRHCHDTRRDIDALALDKEAEDKGVEKYKGNPGLVNCIISIIYMMKGDSEFYQNMI